MVGSSILAGIDARLLIKSALTGPATLIDAGTLKLVVNGQPAKLSCQLVIDPPVWTFLGGRYRAFLITAFDNLLQHCETLEKRVLQPGATEIIRAIVAQHVPSPTS